MDFRELRQWITWRNIDGVKIPYTVDGYRAKVNRPSDFVSYEEACAAGMPAFVFTADDGLMGLDFDDCIVDGELLPRYAELMKQCESYAEISPSGNGIKIWLKGSKPVKQCTKKFDDGTQIEWYEERRFFCYTGNQFLVAREALDSPRLVASLAELFGSNSPSPGSSFSTYADEGFDAARYLRTIIEQDGLPRKGERNNRCFKVAGQLRANGIGEDAIYSLIVASNYHNGLNEVELKKAIQSASRNGTLPPSAEPRLREESSVRINIKPPSKEERDQIQEEDAPVGSFPIDPVTLPGFLGEFSQFCKDTAMLYQPLLSVSAGLACVSAFTGRKVTGYRDIRTNLMLISLCPTGGGKDTPLSALDKLLRTINPQLICGTRVGSASGMLDALHNAGGCSSYVCDEADDLFRAVKGGKSPHLAQVPNYLKEIYNCSGRTWESPSIVARKRLKFDYPHLVMYLCSTPDVFWDGMTSEHITSGLIGRMLIFEEKNLPRKNNFSEPEHGIEAIDHWPKCWAKFQPPKQGNLDVIGKPVKATYEPEAEQRLKEHVDAIHDKRIHEGELERDIWARASERTSKLALVMACSSTDCPAAGVRVLIEHVDIAIKISNWLSRRSHYHAKQLGDSSWEQNVIKLLKVIKQAPNGIRQSAMLRKCRWLRKRDRDEILLHLEGEGSIYYEDELWQAK